MTETLDAVRSVLIETLELTQQPAELDRDTRLFGVVQLVTELEERFDITIDDDEFGADLFETVGTLTDFVDTKLASA
jgi:acyl carrier protein